MIGIALSAGHHPNAKGATTEDGFNEYDEAVKWVAILKELLETREEFSILEIPTGYLSSKIKYLNRNGRANNVQLAIEIHFNAAPGGKAKGSETLYCPGSARGQAAAEIIQRALASFMPPNRGIKEGWYRMDRPGKVDYYKDVDGDESIDAFLSKTFCPALILEPEFIHNRSVIESNRQICCEVIAEAICEYFNTAL